MSFDLKPSRTNNTSSTPFYLFTTVILVAVIIAGYTITTRWLMPEEEVVTLEAPPEITAPPINREQFDGTIPSGATFTTLVAGICSPSEIHYIAEACKDTYKLSRLSAGNRYRIVTIDGELKSFTYDIDSEEQLLVTRGDGETFEANIELIPYQVITEKLTGTITSSLFAAIDEIGEGSELAIAIADIFAWDIDFILDIRVGDHFTVLVEKRFREGESAGYGPVVAAEFNNQDKTYYAFRYLDKSGRAAYFDENGGSMRKTFLKAPLSFTRISSGFTMKRFHPITKTWKSHPAIDYAAPTGTPIKTVGDGTIKRIGYTRGNGNFIEIRHNNSYSTLYLHMKGFARGMKKGRKLSQGQTIGYVGSTGLATGPHLCFRMRKNGAPVNPSRVRSKSAAPIANKQMAEYLTHIDQYLIELSDSQPASIAMHNDNKVEGTN